MSVEVLVKYDVIVNKTNSKTNKTEETTEQRNTTEYLF